VGLYNVAVDGRNVHVELPQKPGSRHAHAPGALVEFITKRDLPKQYSPHAAQ